MKSALTPRQERFIAEYSKDLNATQAAIRAGYSPRTAAPAASRLLINVKVAQEIARLKAEQLEAARWQADEVLEELRWQAHSDIRTFFNEQGDLKPLHELTDAQAACISSHEVILKNAQAGDGKIDRVLKIKLWDKMKALDLAMQHFKLLSPKISEERPIQVSVEVKTLATVLTEPELLLIRERLLERSRATVESGEGRSGARLHQDSQV